MACFFFDFGELIYVTQDSQKNALNISTKIDLRTFPFPPVNCTATNAQTRYHTLKNREPQGFPSMGNPLSTKCFHGLFHPISLNKLTNIHSASKCPFQVAQRTSLAITPLKIRIKRSQIRKIHIRIDIFPQSIIQIRWTKRSNTVRVRF